MNNPQTYIFFGPAGAGKGTQIELLTDYLKETTNKDVVYAYSGAELRKLIESGSIAGKSVQKYLDEGVLAPNFVTEWLITSVIAEKFSGEEHIIFDGFPRSLHQAEMLDDLIKLFNLKDVHVVSIEISDKEAVERLMKRGRHDDTEEGIKARLDVYKNEVGPAISFLKEKYETHVIQGENTIEAIHENIKKALKLS